MNCRGTVAEIDLEAVKKNLLNIRAACGHARVLMAVKADAYGHGAREIARYCESNSLCDAFGVASVEEGLELRSAGIKSQILILGLIRNSTGCIEAALNGSLTLTATDTAFAECLIKTAEKTQIRSFVHIKTDTGMGRIGCQPDDIEKLTNLLTSSELVKLEGIFTHMPVSDTDNMTFNISQISKFKAAASIAENACGYKLIKHMANSAAILSLPESHLDMVRPGIACYGYPPVETKMKFIPVMTFKSSVIFSKRVKKNTGLSYGLTYSPDTDSNIATVPVGYGDGYPRLLSSNAHVEIAGKLYPVAGRVCMDQILVNTFDDSFSEGEDVTLFGQDNITAKTLADTIGTIPYEICCNISKRVPRYYT